MKILYIKLKNYASIYTGLHKKEIEIDFTKCKNNVILLVGANGSGKTSILSTLHPFAYSGNMDVRSNSSLILPEKDGYKEIHIQDRHNLYIITHFYKWTKKESLTVKSFIKKNNEELNPNGNVTSFLEIVKNELNIELEFLKLLRLGSNVTNIIEMKATDRKKFASDLLSDINVYTDLYKKVNDDNRILKGLIKSISEKISKLGIIDESVVKSEINTINERINLLSDDKSKLDRDIGTEIGIINSILPKDINTYDELSNKVHNLRIELDNKSDELRNVMDINQPILLVGDYDEILNRFLDESRSIENQILLKQHLLEMTIDRLDSEITDKDRLDTQLKSFTSVENLNDINSLYSDLLIKINNLEEYFNGNYPTVSKDALLIALNILNEISEISDNIHSFNTDAIKKVFDLIDTGDDVGDYINKESARITTEIFNKMSVDTKESKDAMPMIMYIPSDCNNKKTCPLADYYNNLILYRNNDRKSLQSLEYEKSIIEDIGYINSNINLIIHILKSNDNIINSVRLKYLKFDNIMECIRHDKPIYDETLCMRLMSDIEDYNLLLDYKDKLKDVEVTINNIKSNEAFILSLTESINDKKRSIEELKESVSKYKDELNILNSNKKYTDTRIEVIKKVISSVERINTLRDEINTMHDNYNKLYSILNTAKESENKIELYQNRVESINREIDIYRRDIFDKQIKLDTFIRLNEELEILLENYDEVSIIRDALSSTKGIPLLYIQLYLKNTKIFVNDLLSSVYGEDFEIDDFIINTDEFSIPYIKNGVYVDDVVYASQGERSFLSLALSFALINQSIKDYNILLLDEIDSTLDTKNRAMFLNILENQIDTINAEQVFLITHNNMFDMYPVDIIMTSDVKLDNYKNANIIYKN